MKKVFGQNLAFLRAKKGLNQSEIADIIGISGATWSDYERGKTEPNFSVLSKISDFFRISINTLITDTITDAHLIQKNEELKKHENAHPNAHLTAHLNTVHETIGAYLTPPKVVTVDSEGRDNVVFVPAKARAGYLSGYGDQEFIQNLPAYRLPGLNHGTFRMFEVEGHSMIPTFHESDIMICRYMESFAEIRDNRAYVVVSQREGVVVKRVVNRVQRDGKLILNSDNQRHSGEYPPIVMNPEEVLEIWYVVAFMSRQMREPGELYNRLIDVESRLTLMEEAQRKNLSK